MVEVEIKGFFDHLDHTWLLDMRRVRIDDRAFLNLIGKWLKAGVLETDGHVVHPETGTPQGGTVCATKRIVVMLNIVERSCSIESVLPPQHEG